MKKQLIATLVGGVLLFLWQFLSWSMLGIHANEMKYTPNQDRILEALSQNLEEGAYFLPGVPPGSGPEAEQAAMQQNMGKPWAQIIYHKALNMNMGMSMFRGLVADILAVFLLAWLLMKFTSLDMQTAVSSAVAVGIIGYVTGPYANSIWFETNSLGHLIDAVAQWAIVGAWLGWYIKR